MAGTDDGGLRVGPYVPESGLEPTDGSTENAVTEIIPAVGDGPSGPDEAPKVRAVARRSAVALPALGRPDSAPKVPPSSRSTLDRRERARERERAAAAAAPAASEAPAAAQAVSDPPAVSDAPAAEGEGPQRPRPVNPFAARPPQPRRSPEQTQRSPEVRAAAPPPPVPAPPPPPVPAPPPALAPPPPPPPPSPSLDDTAEVPAFADRGPLPIPDDADRWEEPSGALGNGALVSDTYQGRRRARRRATRPLVVAGIVALLVGALIVVPLMLRSTPSGGTPAAVDAGTQPAVVVPPLPTPTGDDGEISSTAGPGASATPTARPPARTTTRPAPVAPVDPPVTTAAAPTTAPPFQTLTIEGESGNVTAPAERSSYSGSSGGQIVGFLGVTEGRNGQGRLVLSGVSVPTTGTYTVTFHYIANNNRTAHIIVNGNQAGTVAVSARTNCCGTGSLNVTLQAGTNTIEFTNPTGRCPAIDRVVITRP